jgi:cystathionine gamma-lyase / homocysteine desulfhydrase
MDPISKAIHEKIHIDNALPVVTPIFQASAFESESPFFYTRKNNPNIQEFESVVAILEETKYAVATTTGMSAIHLILGLLEINSGLVINADIYGCSYKLFQKYCEKMNIRLSILDLSLSENIKKIPPDTSMVFFETPTNPFLKTINIREVSDYVKSRNKDCMITVDNTWATPLFQKPIKHGADISLHSATKYFSGHSDVMGGCILTDNDDIYNRLHEMRFYQGNILAPNSAWLLRRSLHTLQIRLKTQGKTTVVLKDFLAEHPLVKHVYYPIIDGEQLTNYGTLIFFSFKPEFVKYYPVFTKNLKLFSTGTGMACVSSMVALPYSGSHASMSDKEKETMGLDKSLVRLSFGLEPVDDLKEDLIHALDAVNHAAKTG